MLKQMTEETTRYIQSKTDLRPKIAMVLGSGLGGLGDTLEDMVAIDYEEIPHFVKSTAPGHKGRILIGKLQGKPVLCMQGRFHYYEGYTMQQITYPVRAMKTMGIKTLVLTNACGGLDPSFTPGDLMLVTDHINFQGTNPLIGPNDDDFGIRFPDMTQVYTRKLQTLARDTARDIGVKLQEGTY
ncbi:MAG: purine-nucleoside phosphorylase, partial [Sporomusa sp.]